MTSSHASIHRKLSQPWTLKFSSLYYVLGWIYPVATCIFIKLRQYKDLYSSQVLWKNSLWDKHQQKFLLVFFFFLSFCSNDLFLWHYLEKPGKASIKSSESVIQATFITIRWTAPAGWRKSDYRIPTELRKGWNWGRKGCYHQSWDDILFVSWFGEKYQLHSETVFQKLRIRGRSYCKDN